MMTLEMSGYEVGSDVLTCNRFVVQMLTNDVYSRSKDNLYRMQEHRLERKQT